MTRNPDGGDQSGGAEQSVDRRLTVDGQDVQHAFNVAVMQKTTPFEATLQAPSYVQQSSYEPGRYGRDRFGTQAAVGGPQHWVALGAAMGTAIGLVLRLRRRSRSWARSDLASRRAILPNDRRPIGAAFRR